MDLIIDGTRIRFWNRFNLDLHYDAIASSCSFVYRFNPKNPDLATINRFGEHQSVKIQHLDQTLITGVLLNQKHRQNSTAKLSNLTAYTKTGVLENSNLSTSSYPLERNQLSLREIIESILPPYNLRLVIHSVAAQAANEPFESTTAKPEQTLKNYFSSLASQKNIILTHNSAGNLVLTRANTNQAAAFTFYAEEPPVIDWDLDVNIQNMHSEITVIKEASLTSENANSGESTIRNPYVKNIFKPKVVSQTEGNDLDTEMVARNFLSQELKNIVLTLTLDRWVVNEVFVRPNQIIHVLNRAIGISNLTSFFIQSVKYTGDNQKQTAVLTCVLPEVFNNSQVINRFDL